MLNEIFSSNIINNFCKKKQINAFPINEIIIEDEISDLNIYFKKWNIRSILFVVDQNTKKFLDNIISKVKINHKIFVFEDGCIPSIENVEIIRRESKDFQFLLGIGSGTINDITKYASYLSNKHYAIFITAPSVNGFTSNVASIIFDDYKESISAHLPQYIFIDKEIIANSPLRLIKSGFGDSMAYYTSRMDWMLSHILLSTEYEPEPFIWLENLQNIITQESNKIIHRNRDYIFLLLKNLLISGLGMSYVGNSKPASQGEHMIAHTINLHSKHNLLHGEEIAITSNYMIKLQENILHSKTIPNIKIPDNYINMIKSFFNDHNKIILNYQKKLEDISTIDLEKSWQDVRIKLLDYLIDSKLIEKALVNAEIKSSYLESGWCSQELFEKSVQYAKFYRNRFTFLDFYQ